jgi:hypothetical protein
LHAYVEEERRKGERDKRKNRKGAKERHYQVTRASLTGAQQLGRAKGGTKMKCITRSRREKTRQERHHRCHCFRGALLRNQDAKRSKTGRKDKEREGDNAKEWMKDEGKPSPPPPQMDEMVGPNASSLFSFVLCHL